MKKRLFAAAAAGLLLLAACSGGRPRPIPVDVPPPVEQKNETLKIFYTDYGDIYANMMDTAAVMYRQQFPDRTLEIDRHTPDDLEQNDNLVQQMITQVMSGEGPDLFVLGLYGVDVEKQARNGVFADLEPYFQADNYDWSGFNQAVMEAGVWEGKRLVIPLLYDLPIFYTSKEALEETGFNVENCKDFSGFLDEAEKYLNDPSQSRWLINQYYHFRSALEYGGIPYLDYDTGEIDLTAPELERAAEIYRRLWDNELYGSSAFTNSARIRDKTLLWAKTNYPMDDMVYSNGLLKTFSDPVTLPIRDKDGGIRAAITEAVAVRNNSENLQNAYDFIKILLDEDFGQKTMMWRWQEYSVQNSLVYDYYDYAVTNRVQPFVFPDKPVEGFADIIPPTREEFETFFAYTQEVTGAYYPSACRGGFLNVLGRASDYLDGESYDNALKKAQKQLEIYLSE